MKFRFLSIMSFFLNHKRSSFGFLALIVSFTSCNYERNNPLDPASDSFDEAAVQELEQAKNSSEQASSEETLSSGNSSENQLSSSEKIQQSSSSIDVLSSSSNVEASSSSQYNPDPNDIDTVHVLADFKQSTYFDGSAASVGGTYKNGTWLYEGDEVMGGTFYGSVYNTTLNSYLPLDTILTSNCPVADCTFQTWNFNDGIVEDSVFRMRVTFEEYASSSWGWVAVSLLYVFEGSDFSAEVAQNFTDSHSFVFYAKIPTDRRLRFYAYEKDFEWTGNSARPYFQIQGSGQYQKYTISMSDITVPYWADNVFDPSQVFALGFSLYEEAAEADEPIGSKAGTFDFTLGTVCMNGDC